MGARRTAPNVVNTPTGTRPTREDERERMPIADDPVTRPTFFKSPAQERSASRIPFLTPEWYKDGYLGKQNVGGQKLWLVNKK